MGITGTYTHIHTYKHISVFFLKCPSPPTVLYHQERRLPPPVPKRPPKGPHHHPPLARDRSLESSEKQRQEARKRLMAAKRAASVRQNSATESADSIEIYIPEAQTRLWGHYQGYTQGWHAEYTQTQHTQTQMYGCPHQGYRGVTKSEYWIKICTDPAVWTDTNNVHLCSNILLSHNTDTLNTTCCNQLNSLFTVLSISLTLKKALLITSPDLVS